MIYFLDASALVKHYVDEPGRSVIEAVLRRRIRAASRVSAIEVPAALARRARQGDLEPSIARAHGDQVAKDLVEFDVVEVRRHVLDLAAELVWRHPLRAYDALQLASAVWLRRDTGQALTFVCSDGVLAAAARGENLKALVAG